MTDKKPTDAEIIKALGRMSCKTLDDCNLINDTIDLINRIQKENEGLQKLVNLSIDTQNDLTDKLLQAEENLKTAKAEAYKEFAEKLDNETFGVYYASSLYHVVDIDDVKEILKESVGDK